MENLNAATPDATTTAAATTAAATTKAPAVFWRDADGPAFTPRRGFEAALVLALGDEALTIDEVVGRLRDSGLYAQVAPQALALRPAKPVSFLLRTWAAQGLLRRSA